MALVLLQGVFVLIKGPIERAQGTQALNVQNAAAYLLATCLWNVGLYTNKVGKLQLSMISLSEKKNCMEKLKVEERKWSSCHEHLHVRVASHTSVNQKALRECFLSWHFGSLSLPVAVHLCIHGQS